MRTGGSKLEGSLLLSRESDTSAFRAKQKRVGSFNPMLRLSARKVECWLACVALAGAIVFSLPACGSSRGTHVSASAHPRPANWEVRTGAVNRAGMRHTRNARLVRVAFAQAH